MKPDFTPICPPIGLDRVQAAAYIGAGTSLFDEMVSDGRMPQPRQMNARTVWDREELYLAFKALPYRNGPRRPQPEAGGPRQPDYSKVNG